MNTITIGLGIAIIIFGVYTLFMRSKRPQRLGRLQAMKDLFGPDTGDRIHLAAYAVMPLVAGTAFIVAGMLGTSIF